MVSKKIDLLSIGAIKKANKPGKFLAVGTDGNRYDASYDPEYGVMFFTVPSSVGVLGYEPFTVAETAEM